MQFHELNHDTQLVIRRRRNKSTALGKEKLDKLMKQDDSLFSNGKRQPELEYCTVQQVSHNAIQMYEYVCTYMYISVLVTYKYMIRSRTKNRPKLIIWNVYSLISMLICMLYFFTCREIKIDRSLIAF